MNFSTLLESCSFSEEEGSVLIPQDWMQGRSAFGGLQAALLLRAIRARVPGAPPLRNFQVNFVAPVPQDQPLMCAVQVLRQGRNVLQVQARLLYEGNILCLATGIFGASRQSLINLAPLMRRIEGATTGVGKTLAAETTAPFLQHFSLLWLQGDPPFSGAEQTESVVELAHRDPMSTTEAHIVALADVVPLAGLSLLQRPAARSSLSWMLELLTDSLDGLPREGWRMDTALVAAASGYTHQSGILWGPGNQPVALSRQTGAIFA